MDTIESKVSSTILQQTRIVEVGNRTYNVSPPSTATLILVSDVISKMPETKLDNENIIAESLSIAKDCKPLGEIAAILIIGAKKLLKNRWYLFGIDKLITYHKKKALSKFILEELGAKELNLKIYELLKEMEIADFFALTTFLTETNLLRPTKVESKTTASGQ